MVSIPTTKESKEVTLKRLLKEGHKCLWVVSVKNDVNRLLNSDEPWLWFIHDNPTNVINGLDGLIPLYKSMRDFTLLKNTLINGSEYNLEDGEYSFTYREEDGTTAYIALSTEMHWNNG